MRGERERRLERREALAAAIPTSRGEGAEPAASAEAHGAHVQGRDLQRAPLGGPQRRERARAARAGFVILELDADVIALQEVLRPFDRKIPRAARGRDASAMASSPPACTGAGEIGNAILLALADHHVFSLDLSFLAHGAPLGWWPRSSRASRPYSVVATHLALVDRTRRLQVDSILGHPQLQGTGSAPRRHERVAALQGHADARARARGGGRYRLAAPFPQRARILALDRVYARGATIEQVAAHEERGRALGLGPPPRGGAPEARLIC